MEITKVKHHLYRTKTGANVNPIDFTLLTSIEVPGGMTNIRDVSLEEAGAAIIISLTEDSQGTDQILVNRNFQVSLLDPEGNWIPDIQVHGPSGLLDSTHQESGDEDERPIKKSMSQAAH